MDFSKFVSESNPFSRKKLVQKRLIVSIKPKEPGLFDQLNTCPGEETTLFGQHTLKLYSRPTNNISKKKLTSLAKIWYPMEVTDIKI